MSSFPVLSVVRLQEKVGLDHPDRDDATEYIATTLRVSRQHRRSELVEAEAEVHSAYDQYATAVRKYEGAQDSFAFTDQAYNAYLSDSSSDTSSTSSSSHAVPSRVDIVPAANALPKSQVDFILAKHAELMRASPVNLNEYEVGDQEA